MTGNDAAALDPEGRAVIQGLVEFAVANLGAEFGELSLSVAEAILKTYPDNVEVIHWAGEVCRAGGNDAAALALFLNALSISESHAFSLVSAAKSSILLGDLASGAQFLLRATAASPLLGIEIRAGAAALSDAGRSDLALDVLLALSTADPGSAANETAIARLLVWRDDRPGSVSHYQTALHLGNSDELYSEYLGVLSDIGYYDEVLSEASSVAFVRDLNFRCVASMHLCNAFLELEHSNGAPSPASAPLGDFGEIALAAVDAGGPFSLIRLGDGEARLLLIRDEVDALSSEKAASAQVVWRNWFGVDLDRAEFERAKRMAGELESAIGHASVIGIPNQARLNEDYRHRGFLLDLVARVKALANADCVFTDASGPDSLADRTPFMHRVAEQGRPLALITPHEGLAQDLSEELGFPVRHIRVPAEQGVEQLPEALKEGNHLEAFEARSDEISQLPAGTVILVGAGLLGKLYCETGRQAGCIALDMGSVLDVWAGWSTRPHHSKGLQEP